LPRQACKKPPKDAIQARNDLITAHLPMVRTIAKRVAASLPASFELDDLVQSGYLGLLTAASRYAPASHGGTPFSAYARLVVHGAIVDSVRRGAYVESTRMSAALVPESTIDTEVDSELDRQTELRRLQAAIKKLPQRHARVVRLHYQKDLRLAAVAPILRVGKSRASQLHMEAVRELRHRLSR
jgi:RNA polymerase sigma factor (sigma-70 family)